MTLIWQTTKCTERNRGLEANTDREDEKNQHKELTEGKVLFRRGSRVLCNITNYFQIRKLLIKEEIKFNIKPCHALNIMYV